MKQLSELASEVMQLARDKQTRLKDLDESARRGEEQYRKAIDGLLKQVTEWLSPFTSVGIELVLDPTTLSKDFGKGAVSFDVPTLSVLADAEEVFALKPFVPASDDWELPRFKFVDFDMARAIVMRQPRAIKEHLGWVAWVNEADKTKDPVYVKFDETFVMTRLKEYYQDQAIAAK
ncbi:MULTISPECIES: hypothetical protein [Pseudomonas]|uniref:hypothetical protein n=1 Tax=Pseudomonas nitroreducens TaxID=46680 RepID=UPI001E464522|nr:MULTISPECIES: hypothetical protein [Pseudomonas]MCE4070148.1 hypothetical protein [Pseudomonas nitritireducens]MCE4078753.1 hypothetical protein [Pseudomonas nitroreducens]